MPDSPSPCSRARRHGWGAACRRGRAAAAPARLRLVAAGVPAPVPAAGGRRGGDVGGRPGGCDINPTLPCPGSRSAGAACSTLGSRRTCARHTAPSAVLPRLLGMLLEPMLKDREVSRTGTGAVAVTKLVVTPGRVRRQSAASSGLHHRLRRRLRAATGRRQARAATLAPAVASCLGVERGPAARRMGLHRLRLWRPAGRAARPRAEARAPVRVLAGQGARPTRLHRDHAERVRKRTQLAGRADMRTISLTIVSFPVLAPPPRPPC